MALWLRVMFMLLFVVSSIGCASRNHPPSPANIVPVESLANIAGQWKETPWRMSGLWSNGDLRVSIASAGSYVAWSDRGQSLATDAGKLIVIDGKLVSDTQRLISTFTVVQSHGKPVLVVELIGKEGDHSYVRLVRDVP
jgi:hypothetical protein